MSFQRFVELEAVVFVNTFIAMLLISFFFNCMGKTLSVAMSFFVQRYFEAKKQYLTDLAKAEIPSDDGSVRKFN